MNDKNTSYPLLLLHGALGSQDQFDEIVAAIGGDRDIYRLNFEGHGQAGPTNSPFRMEYFVENVLGFLDEHSLRTVNIFGYSMGGYVALMLAKEYPESVNRVATLGTILEWNEEVARRECRYLHPEKIREKVPHFAEQLHNRHTDGWERVVDRTREMLLHLGSHPLLNEKDWKQFRQPVRFHVGDRDSTAGLDATIDVCNKISRAELCVLPDTGHAIAEVNRRMLGVSINNFF